MIQQIWGSEAENTETASRRALRAYDSKASSNILLSRKDMNLINFILKGMACGVDQSQFDRVLVRR
jgi:hypothetical protein